MGAKDGWRAGAVPEHRDAGLGRSAYLGDGERVAGGEQKDRRKMVGSWGKR